MKEFNDILAAYRRNMFLYKEDTPTDIMALYRTLPNLKITDKQEKNLFHIAAMFFDHQAIDYLAAEGIKPRADENDNTPLHEMTKSPYGNDITNYERMDEDIYLTAKKLIELGVNPKKKNYDEAIAYFEAGKANMYPFIRAMVDSKVRMDVVDGENKNLLHIIAERYYHRKNVKGVPEASAKTVKYLLEAGCPDPEDKDIFEKTPLMYAQSSSAYEIAALLSGDDSIMKTGGMTLDEAILKDDAEVVKALLEGGADVNEYSDKKRTPLMRACEFPSPEILDILLEAHADVNYKSGETGITAIYLLLTSGIVNLKPIRGRSPRTIIKMLRKLIDGGLDLKATITNNGDTVLSAVCALGYTGGINNRLAEELIDGGVDVNAANLAGQTPLMIFALNGNEQDNNIAELLIDNGARCDVTDKYSNTPLMYATANSNHMSAKKIVELMLETGHALPERTNNNGKTAMDIAVEMKNEAVVKLLITAM